MPQEMYFDCSSEFAVNTNTLVANQGFIQYPPKKANCCGSQIAKCKLAAFLHAAPPPNSSSWWSSTL